MAVMERFRDGALTLFHWRGRPVRAHWMLALGALLFGHPIEYFTIVLLHEFGHALLVQRYGLWVEEIMIHGFGGWCRWRGHATPLQRSVIAWGGVWAQMLLLAGTLLAFEILGPPTSAIGWGIHDSFIGINLFLIVLNLIPIKPLDGAEAWRLIPLLIAHRRRARRRHKRPGSGAPKFKWRPADRPAHKKPASGESASSNVIDMAAFQRERDGVIDYTEEAELTDDEKRRLEDCVDDIFYGERDDNLPN